jgi:hypothetical protein
MYNYFVVHTRADYCATVLSLFEHTVYLYSEPISLEKSRD